jgi:hypothetical protein
LFLCDDGYLPPTPREHFGGVGKIEKSLCSIDGNFYLFGNVVRASKLPKKGSANVAAYDGGYLVLEKPRFASGCACY